MVAKARERYEPEFIADCRGGRSATESGGPYREEHRPNSRAVAFATSSLSLADPSFLGFLHRRCGLGAGFRDERPRFLVVLLYG